MRRDPMLSRPRRPRPAALQANLIRPNPSALQAPLSHPNASARSSDLSHPYPPARSANLSHPCPPARSANLSHPRRPRPATTYLLFLLSAALLAALPSCKPAKNLTTPTVTISLPDSLPPLPQSEIDI